MALEAKHSKCTNNLILLYRTLNDMIFCGLVILESHYQLISVFLQRAAGFFSSSIFFILMLMNYWQIHLKYTHSSES